MTTNSIINLPAGFVALVIGGSGAIGRACLHAFVAAGATVISVDINHAAALAGLPETADGRAYGCDVTNVEEVTALAEQVGAVDAVVYAAGLNHDGDIIDLEWSEYRRVMAVNLDGAFHITSAFGRSMVAAERRGAFVFVSSTAGLSGEAGASIYCATKFGLIGMMECAAAEFAPRGIRANAVCPGNVDSPMLCAIAEKIAIRTGETTATVLSSMTNQGAATRLVMPREVADLCVCLSSPLSTAITGTTVRVDAGAMLSA